jgi:hypothetical protein
VVGSLTPSRPGSSASRSADPGRSPGIGRSSMADSQHTADRVRLARRAADSWRPSLLVRSQSTPGAAHPTADWSHPPRSLRSVGAVVATRRASLGQQPG